MLRLLDGFASNISYYILALQDSEGQGVITDRGVHAMCPVSGDPHISKIENLVLTFSSVTEKSVERLLKSIPSLKSLDVRGNNPIKKKSAAGRGENIINQVKLPLPFPGRGNCKFKWKKNSCSFDCLMNILNHMTFYNH